MAGTPNYLAAVDKKRQRVFVLATPNLSALRFDNKWHCIEPLSEDEIKNYELITDLRIVLDLVNEAKRQLNLQKDLN